MVQSSLLISSCRQQTLNLAHARYVKFKRKTVDACTILNMHVLLSLSFKQRHGFSVKSFDLLLIKNIFIQKLTEQNGFLR